MVTEIRPGVYWVGVVDWELRRFHGHELSTHRGSTYNSYLVVDEKVALVDAVWEPFSDALIAQIREVIDPAKIDYVVANHAETDHSGSLRDVVRAAPNAEVVVSKRGAESVEGNHHLGVDYRVVKTGETISLGKKDLVFIEAAMLHWPDTMFTYLTGENVLISSDAFGQHYATAGRFNDEVDRHELYQEALKYYVNIVAPFSDFVLKKIDEVGKLDLPIDVIAPSHGVIWRDDPMQIISTYAEWARQEPEPTAVIVYDTMWHATAKMAEAIGEGLAEAGVDYKIYHAATADRNDIMTEIFKARTVLVGASTVNRGVLPGIYPTIMEMKGLGFKNKLAGAFGSYGWSGEAAKILHGHLTDCGYELVGDPVRAKWNPDGEAIEECRTFGKMAGEATRKPVG